MDKNDITISSRMTDFNVQISAVKIETVGEAILNLSGQIDLSITLKTSHYLFNIKLL